jgi:undecaprenyl-diphosphatase
VSAAEPRHTGWATVDEFDRTVAEWLEGVHHPALDRFFYSLSTAADHSALWIALGSVEALRRGTPSLAVRIGVSMGIESGLTNGLIKSAFRRVRPPSHPFHPPEGPLPYGMRRPITSSFPSGHATAAFTAATLLSTKSRNRTAWFALAGLVAGSRVYVRMHHASDVVAGAALGLALGQVLRRALRFD